MSHQLKQEYLNAIRERYRNSSRGKKSLILDKFCHVCGHAGTGGLSAAPS